VPYIHHAMIGDLSHFTAHFKDGKLELWGGGAGIHCIAARLRPKAGPVSAMDKGDFSTPPSWGGAFGRRLPGFCEIIGQVVQNRERDLPIPSSLIWSAVRGSQTRPSYRPARPRPHFKRPRLIRTDGLRGWTTDLCANQRMATRAKNPFPLRRFQPLRLRQL